MVYSDVINQSLHLVLPKKKKYMIKDYKQVLKQKNELSYTEARFVVICTAIYHDAEYSSKLKHVKQLTILFNKGGLISDE